MAQVRTMREAGLTSAWQYATAEGKAHADKVDAAYEAWQAALLARQGAWAHLDEAREWLHALPARTEEDWARYIEAQAQANRTARACQEAATVFAALSQEGKALREAGK